MPWPLILHHLLSLHSGQFVMSSPVISVPTYMPMQEAAVKFPKLANVTFWWSDADGRRPVFLSQKMNMAINQGI